jgi:hypothetical protein
MLSFCLAASSLSSNSARRIARLSDALVSIASTKEAIESPKKKVDVGGLTRLQKFTDNNSAKINVKLFPLPNRLLKPNFFLHENILIFSEFRHQTKTFKKKIKEENELCSFTDIYVQPKAVLGCQAVSFLKFDKIPR